MRTLDRIKDVNGIKLREFEVLLKVKELPSSIVLLNKENDQQENAFLEIVKKGDAVKDFNVGDIVLKLDVQRAAYFSIKEQDYFIAGENSLKLVVEKDNFDLPEENSTSIN